MLGIILSPFYLPHLLSYIPSLRLDPIHSHWISHLNSHSSCCQPLSMAHRSSWLNSQLPSRCFLSLHPHRHCALEPECTLQFQATSNSHRLLSLPQLSPLCSTCLIPVNSSTSLFLRCLSGPLKPSFSLMCFF